MAGRELPASSPFAGDDGSCDPRLAAALDAFGRGDGSLAQVVTALAGTRVLVPVLAELETADVVEVGEHRHTIDKEASAGIVALRAPDGRTALPVFSSVASMAAWRSDARPVPSDVARAALSAVTEQWELIVLDPGGPTTVLVPRPAVWALAQQQEWQPAVIRTAGVDAVDPRIRSAIGRAIGAVAGVLAVDTVPGRRAEVAAVLTLVPGLDRARLDDVLGHVNAALAADEAVTASVDSLELRVLAGP
ncbi:SseB family protein [Cellulomonas sp.]|uniref:SseB family protein n=1 Tax=Cellulomonas sp. TaxID=40001 RepID=UPI0039C8B0F7